MSNLEDVKGVLNEYGQEHLLSFYNNLNMNEQNLLFDQVSKIDFPLVDKLYNISQEEKQKQSIFQFENASRFNQEDILQANQLDNPDYGGLSDVEQIKQINKKELSINSELMERIYASTIEKKTDCIEPIEYLDKSKISEEDKKKYEEIGLEAVKKGQYAVVTMAGGQGTRLGFNGPKGAYMLDLDAEKKSLFEILCSRLKEIKDQYDVVIPWYIMTSSENNNDTIKFFESNKYFGYPKESIKFFVQGELPMILKNGNIVLEEKWKVKEGADGHGGIFTALKKNHITDEMRENGVKWFFVCGIDNILAKLVDLEFLGLVIDQKVLVASKSVLKANPTEKVGVFCLRNGRPSVVEYTEISDEMSKQTLADGELKFSEANILAHIFSIDLVDLIEGGELPYHVALKKTDYIDENGKKVIPTEENAYKFECFIFDAFYKADKMLVLRVKREHEFAPIKNADGVDSPQTARELYIKYIK